MGLQINTRFRHRRRIHRGTRTVAILFVTVSLLSIGASASWETNWQKARGQYPDLSDHDVVCRLLEGITGVKLQVPTSMHREDALLSVEVNEDATMSFSDKQISANGITVFSLVGIPP